MISNSDLKNYKKKNNYSYCFGAYPTIELLKNKPDCVEKVLIRSDAKEEIREKVETLCHVETVPLLIADRVIERICEKENCLVVGVFRKYQESIGHDKNHIVLVNPSDSGNMGTIIRSSVGFGIHDLAIIEPSVDIFHPKTVRASMGALFHIRFRYFQDFEAYDREYGSERELYPFMLKGTNRLGCFQPNPSVPFSLIFGNEASGLDDSFLNIGKSILIAHSDEIDSLNLSLASGIGIYEFTKHSVVK